MRGALAGLIARAACADVGATRFLIVYYDLYKMAGAPKGDDSVEEQMRKTADEERLRLSTCKIALPELGYPWRGVEICFETRCQAMNDLTHSTIDDFLNALADRQPAPGGGAVAALTGGLAAALGRMVAAYSVGKNTPADVWATVAKLSAQLRTMDELQRALMTQDAEAYVEMTELGRAVRNDPEQRAAYQGAVLRAVAVPMEMATLALQTLLLLDDAKEALSHYMVSDLGVVAVTARAAVEAASYMVRVNLSALDDPAVRAGTAEQIRSVCARSEDGCASIQAFVSRRLEAEA